MKDQYIKFRVTRQEKEKLTQMAEKEKKTLSCYLLQKGLVETDDLIAWGGLGVTEFSGVEAVIKQFYSVQKTYGRNGDFGRYMDHEIFSLSPEAEKELLSNHADLDRFARQMARDIYENDHCQVVYGVHRPDKSDSHMHIHFGINTVSFLSGRKRRENKRQTREQEERFEKIVEEEIGRHCRE